VYLHVYCQKLEVLTYIFAVDSVGLRTFISFYVIMFEIEPPESKTASAKTEFYMK